MRRHTDHDLTDLFSEGRRPHYTGRKPSGNGWNNNVLWISAWLTGACAVAVGAWWLLSAIRYVMAGR